MRDVSDQASSSKASSEAESLPERLVKLGRLALALMSMELTQMGIEKPDEPARSFPNAAFGIPDLHRP
jgi:hypothetical protein